MEVRAKGRRGPEVGRAWCILLRAGLSPIWHRGPDRARRALLARLTSGETSVTELAEPFEMSLPAVSKHLKVLERAGLIARGREAQWRPCRLEAGPLRDVADWVEQYRQFWDQSFDRLDDYLDAPRDLVFKAWTEPERLMRWWAPKGWTTPFCKIDLRPGGVFHYCMRSPEGRDFWGKGVYREVVEPSLLVYTDSFSDEEGKLVEPAHYGLSPDHPGVVPSTPPPHDTHLCFARTTMH